MLVRVCAHLRACVCVCVCAHICARSSASKLCARARTRRPVPRAWGTPSTHTWGTPECAPALLASTGVARVVFARTSEPPCARTAPRSNLSTHGYEFYISVMNPGRSLSSVDALDMHRDGPARWGYSEYPVRARYSEYPRTAASARHSLMHILVSGLCAHPVESRRRCGRTDARARADTRTHAHACITAKPCVRAQTYVRTCACTHTHRYIDADA
jgi:hypothetical protein